MNESPTSPPPLPSEAPASRTSGFAIASLIFGILSIFLFILASIPAIICGIVALIRIGNSRGRLTGKGLAISGIVVGMLFTLLLPAILLPALARAREAARRSMCDNNLRQMAIVFRMYANESKGEVYPMLSSKPGGLTCAAEEVYPEYLEDPYVLHCPSDSDAPPMLAGANGNAVPPNLSYTYLGYVIMNDDELEAFAEVYRQRVAQHLPFDEDLEAPPGRGSMGTNKFLRLRKGIERYLVADINDPSGSAKAQSLIPIMWDRAESISGGGIMFNHFPGGANVLFLDGHVEFVLYPGSWPLTPRSLDVFSELSALRR